MAGRLLVLGGGGFLGFHVVAAGLAAGHDVTVVSRSGKAPLDGVHALTADRNDDLTVLRGRTWDAVVDTFTDPDPGAPAVARSAAALSGSVGLYCYVSGMSVYAPDGPPIPTETAPVRRGGVEPDSDPLQERSLAKLAGEQAVHNGFRGPTLIPRVGIMVGPRDPSGRFTWWPMQYFRALTGAAPATVVCPGPGGRAVQYSDARDIGAWLVDMSMRGEGGLFNTVGPLRYETLSDVLTACEAAARDVVAERGRPRRQSVVVRKTASEDALRTALAAVPEEDRPLWYPEDQIPQQAIDSRAAFAAGLRFRSARRTAEDTLRWALGQKDAPLTAFAQPPA